MARKRENKTILKELFKKYPIIRKEKITEVSKNGKETEKMVDIPLVGRVEADINGKRYNGFMSPYFVYLDDENSYDYDLMKRHLDYAKSANRIVSDSLHNNYYRIDLYRDIIKDHINKCKSEGNKMVYKIEFEKDKVFGVNPEYLLNILDFCDTDYIYINPDSYQIAPIITFTEDDEYEHSKIALTLPCRI